MLAVLKEKGLVPLVEKGLVLLEKGFASTALEYLYYAVSILSLAK